MGREEQIEEREVLESIFPEEITDVSETEFRIDVKLDLPDAPTDNDDDASFDPPSFTLAVRYPEAYPDEAPQLDMLVSPTSNSNSNNSASPHPLFSVSEDREALLAGLADTIQENLGMAMVFTLVSALKEAAEQLIQDREAAAHKVIEERALEAERAENAKFHGTPVTPETFTRWRDDFLREMEAVRAQEEEERRLAEMKKAKAREPVKLTGKQLWQQGLVGKVDEGEEDGDEDGEDGTLAEGVEQLKVEG